jgi:hypothetical protein
MALSLSSVVADVGATFAVQTGATTTTDTLKSGSGTLFKVEIDNSANMAAVYVKLYNNVGGAPTGDGTDPNFVFKCPGQTVKTFSCPKGTAFANALYARCVTTGGTAGTANPPNAAIYRILFT